MRQIEDDDLLSLRGKAHPLLISHGFSTGVKVENPDGAMKTIKEGPGVMRNEKRGCLPAKVPGTCRDGEQGSTHRSRYSL